MPFCAGMLLLLNTPLSSLAQAPAGAPPSADQELQSRVEAASSAQQTGNPEAIAEANKRLAAFSLREMAQLRSVQELYPIAIELFKRSLALEPSIEAQYGLAFDYFRAGRPDEGLSSSDALIKADPKNATYWNLQGKLWMMKKNYNRAVDSLGKSLELQSDPEVAYTLATVLLQLKQKDKAAVLFSQMEQSAGNKAPIYVMVGRAYETTGFSGDAEAEYKKAIAVDPKTSRGHYYLGLFYLTKNGFETTPQARQEFLAEVQENPTDFFGNYFMGYITSNEKNYAESDRYLKVAAAARPDWPEPYLYLGLNAYGRGDNAAAEQYLRKAIELTGKDEARNNYQIRRAYFTLGRILIIKGDKGEGTKYVERSKAIETKLVVTGRQQQALANSEATGAATPNEGPPAAALPTVTNPAAPLDTAVLAASKLSDRQKTQLAAAEKELRTVLGNAYNDLGTAEARQKEYASALVNFQEAERWDPETPNVMRNIGRAAFLQQNYAESARALKVYVQQNPQDQRAQGMLALALFSIKNYSEAAPIFDRLGDQPMSDPFMAYAWATSLARTNNKQRASDILEKLTASPIPPPILVAAGRLYAELGDSSKAQTCYQKAKEEDPSITIPN
ncbi:MAG TPA: tetratricopeptide repeat protein [Terriglobales bacterium]|nr:tetratricopeptide repeat protein [Terriglobales bacterium]